MQVLLWLSLANIVKKHYAQSELKKKKKKKNRYNIYM